MIQTHNLVLTIDLYTLDCMKQKTKPTIKGLASALNTTPSTIFNILRGSYNQGHEYSNKPSPNRLVSNNDFELIRELFKAD